MANQASRYISNLTRDTYALILAGGRGSRLYELTNWRAKPALYFGLRGVGRVDPKVAIVGWLRCLAYELKIAAEFQRKAQ